MVVGAGGHLIDPGVEKEIARFVARRARNADDQTTDDMTVDPAILSIFCRELNNTRQRAPGCRGSPGSRRRRPGRDHRGLLPPQRRRSAARGPAGSSRSSWSPPSGYRNSVGWDQRARDRRGEGDRGPLVDRRLDPRGGAPPRARIELTHDVLTEPIVQSRNSGAVREDDERAGREEEARARTAAANEEQRRREREELDTKRRALRTRSVPSSC